jgi:hypothetical protein
MECAKAEDKLWFFDLICKAGEWVMRGNWTAKCERGRFAEPNSYLIGINFPENYFFPKLEIRLSTSKS